MNEETLKQGIEIKKRLDAAREIRANIKAKQDLCIGNYSEVAARRFDLEITEGNQIKRIFIDSNTAYTALGTELNNINKIVSAIEKELEELN